MSSFEQIRNLVTSQDATKDIENACKVLWENEIKSGIDDAVARNEHAVQFSVAYIPHEIRTACHDYIIRHAGWSAANISWSSWPGHEKPGSPCYNCLLTLKW